MSVWVAIVAADFLPASHALGSGEAMRLAVDLWYKRSGTGTPMVLLHGGPGAGSSYLKAFEAISDEQILVRAGVAADAGKAVLQHAAGEELLGDWRDDGTLRAVLAHETVVADCLPSVQVIRYQPQERRRLRASELVYAACRRGCVGQRRSRTEERRAYA